MILKKEIGTIAEQKEVAPTTVDKDWVLSHVLDAIYSIPRCKESLIFKGGTCLKKCYFPEYRFSEDIDFTSSKIDFVLDEKMVNEIIDLVKKRAEIPLGISKLEQLKFNDELTGYSAVLKYWGADHSRNEAPPPPERWTTNIKIEVILYELIVFQPIEKPIIHQYSDKLSETANAIPCYSLQEVLAEKLRSLIQRSYTAPRDFFDIWYLAKNAKDVNWDEVVAAFHKKMEFKKFEFKGIDQMINQDNAKILKRSWDQSLKHQIPAKEFQTYEIVEKELTELLNKLFPIQNEAQDKEDS
jgi:predicted nucleotidyltransferase component of viral defense system